VEEGEITASEAEGDQPDASEGEENVNSPAEPNDTYIKKQWALTAINAVEAWDILDHSNTQRVTVAILDSGVDGSHEDLIGNLMFDASGDVVGYNSVTETNDVSEVSRDAGVYGHGTHVAGILAACANNAKGVAGVSYNQAIYPVKIFDTSGNATTRALLAGYQHVLEVKDIYGIRVVNMSVGTARQDSALEQAILTALADGVVSVAASGNEDSTEPCYPCDFDSVVGVINVKQDSTNSDGLSRSPLSNYNAEGACVRNISAPGNSIYSTYPGNSYGNNSGTSMAAPCVSGVLAMMFAVNPNLPAAYAPQLLYNTARDLGEAGFDEETGWGVVDAKAAVQAAKDLADGTSTIDFDSSEYLGHRSLSGTMVSQIKPVYLTGQPVKPQLTVTSSSGEVLKEGVDYEVTYSDNDRIGLGMAVVTGIGSYTGEVVRTFEIVAKPVYTLGATRMPVSSTCTWSVKNGSLKVVSGKGVASIASDGKTVRAKATGTAKVAVVDNVGRTVRTQTVSVYKLSGAFFLQSGKSSKLNASVKKGSKTSNARAVVAKAKNTKSQKVKFVLSNGYYRAKFVHSGKYLTVKSASKKSGAAVVQRSKSSSKSQQWKISVDGKNRLTFTNRNSGKVLVIRGTVKSGAGLSQRVPSGALREKWVPVK